MKNTLLLIFIFITNAAYTQCIKGDCQNGIGVYSFNNGDTYVGEFRNGKRHGLGTYSFVGGRLHTGQWAYNEKHGLGVTTFEGGSVLQSDYNNGKRHGTAVQFDEYMNCVIINYYYDKIVSNSQTYYNCYDQLITVTKHRDRIINDIKNALN